MGTGDRARGIEATGFRSLAVAFRMRAIWLRDATGDRSLTVTALEYRSPALAALIIAVLFAALIAWRFV